MKSSSIPRQGNSRQEGVFHKGKAAFTLLETVIAIGVLAVLLTGFMAVFGPAASGIRRAINIQDADRLASTVERELVNLRDGQSVGGAATTGFQKAFNWIGDSHKAANALFVYQYRGSIGDQRPDGSLEPFEDLKGSPGSDYTVMPAMRRLDDPLFSEDLKALEGPIFYVKCTQLVRSNGELVLGTPGEFSYYDDNTETTATASSEDAYKDAVIAFAADFYTVSARTASYIQGSSFSRRFENQKTPMFTRNLAVRR